MRIKIMPVENNMNGLLIMDKCFCKYNYYLSITMV